MTLLDALDLMNKSALYARDRKSPAISALCDELIRDVCDQMGAGAFGKPEGFPEKEPDTLTNDRDRARANEAAIDEAIAVEHSELLP